MTPSDKQYSFPLQDSDELFTALYGKTTGEIVEEIMHDPSVPFVIQSDT